MNKLLLSIVLLSLTACTFTHPIKGVVENKTHEHFLGTATASLFEANASINIVTDSGTSCSGTYPRPELSSGSVSANGTFTCTDGRTGIFAFSGAANGGDGFGKFNNGQKFTFVYGNSSSLEDNGAMAASHGVSASEFNEMYDSCIKQQAELLDDGISPANIIGRSIADACTKEYIASAMQIVSADNQAVKNAFYRQLTYARDLAAAGPTHYVLSRRDYLRTHKNPKTQ